MKALPGVAIFLLISSHFNYCAERHISRNMKFLSKSEISIIYIIFTANYLLVFYHTGL